MGLEQYTTKKRIICFPPWPVIYFLILFPPYYQVGELVTYWEPCNGLSPTGIHTKGQHSYIEEFRGSEAVESFYCKFIFRDCRVQGQKIFNRSKTSLYYSELLFKKVSPQVFCVKFVCCIGFPRSSYLVLFTIPLRMILT